MSIENFLRDIPESIENEVFEKILTSEKFRIERIVSDGHISPEGHWYDQETNEWVMVLQGKAIIEFEDGMRKELNPFDFVDIPAHVMHRVAWTNTSQKTIWLAIHY